MVNKTFAISYSHKDFIEADKLDNELSNFGVNLVRDIKVFKYKDNIISYMNTIKNYDYIFVLISKDYLLSEACMYEVCVILNDNYNNYQKKILPIFIDNEIFKENSELIYLNYWNNKYQEYKNFTNNLNNIYEIKERVDLLYNITNNIIKFIKFIKSTYIEDINDISKNILYYIYLLDNNIINIYYLKECSKFWLYKCLNIANEPFDYGLETKDFIKISNNDCVNLNLNFIVSDHLRDLYYLNIKKKKTKKIKKQIIESFEFETYEVRNNNVTLYYNCILCISYPKGWNCLEKVFCEITFTKKNNIWILSEYLIKKRINNKAILI